MRLSLLHQFLTMKDRNFYDEDCLTLEAGAKLKFEYKYLEQMATRISLLVI